MRLTISLLILFSTLIASAQEVNIIPQPVEMKVAAGYFQITASTVIVAKNGVDNNTANFLNSYLKQFYGYKLKIVKEAASNYIQMITLQTLVAGKSGAYSLNITSKGINIQGQTSSGTFYGMQTFLQLLPVWDKNSKVKKINFAVPQLTITDYPRFAYRGLHLDVGRHFMPVDFIKKYIDYIALHKMNYFHWHLTEDQGWRIEIKKYPKLTSVGGWRNGTIIGRYPGTGNDNIKYGGFYTQEQVKEIVKYASDRYITVVPEIEMPGHSSAAIAAYPELSCFPDKQTEYPKQFAWNGSTAGKQVQQIWGVFDDVFCAGKENTFKFLEDVMDEVLALFPSKYVHVGGDECPKEHWKKCPACQQRMKDNGLKDEHGLQSYFIQRMEKYLNKKGRTLIGWDEILEGGLAPNAVVMSWRGEKGGIDAAKENHDVIMTPGNPVYFDHSQTDNEDSVTIGGFNPIEKVYAYEPVPKELNAEQAKHVLGAQANIWTEYMNNTSKIEYMLFPRLSALSEVLWSPKENRNWDDFQKRLLVQFKRYDLWKVNYSKAYFDLKATVLPTKEYNGVIWKLTKQGNSGQMKVQENGLSFKFISEKAYETAIRNNGKYEATLVEIISEISNKETGRRRTIYKPISSLITQTFHFNNATGKKITLTNEASKNYPGDGAFTLVNGVINEKGMASTKEFLSFSGTDCEAVIDLGELKEISFVVVNCLERKSSWIWRPQSAEVLGSGDGQTWYPLKNSEEFIDKNNGTGKGTMTIAFRATFARYLKIVVKNWGEIPAGSPGAGNKAWLFVDEIEVN